MLPFIYQLCHSVPSAHISLTIFFFFEPNVEEPMQQDIHQRVQLCADAAMCVSPYEYVSESTAILLALALRAFAIG